MRKLSYWGLAAVLLFFTATIAQAVPITFSFEGNVTTVPTELSGTFNTSQTLFGSFTFQSIATDSHGSTNIGVYPIDGLNINIGTYNAFGNDGENWIINNPPFYEFYEIYSGSTFTGPNIGSFNLNNFVFSIGNLEPSSVITNDSLWLTPPNVSDFTDFNIWKLSFIDGTNTVSVEGSITNIPEPSTLLLLGSGLVGLVGFGRRKVRK